MIIITPNGREVLQGGERGISAAYAFRNCTVSSIEIEDN
jgi:hypothetical protein